MISPENNHKDFQKFDESFQVQFEFEDYCTGSVDRPSCQSNLTPLDDLCDRCKETMQDEISEWRRAQAILADHDKPTMQHTQKYLVPG
jgi:hypothetical protein